MSDELRRRQSDEEAFKYKIIEQQAKIQEGIKDIRDDIRDHGTRIINVETAIWGYPKSDATGLLEQHRSMLKTWAVIIGVLSFAAAALGRLVSPLYDKWVADWAFNSPSEKWLRETKQPKVKVYKIYRKKETTGGTDQPADQTLPR